MWEGGTPGRLGRLSPGPLDVLLSLKEGGLCPAAAPAVCLLCSHWPTHSEHPSPYRTWPSPIPLSLGFRGHRAALQAVAFSHELTFTKGFLVPPFLQAPSAPCGETAWPWEQCCLFLFFLPIPLQLTASLPLPQSLYNSQNDTQKKETDLKLYFQKPFIEYDHELHF